MAAIAAEAASVQNKFWRMHDVLYDNQEDLSDERLVEYAASLGLDMDRFFSDLTHQTYLKRIESDLQSGLKSGVDGTPALFVNGERYEGHMSFAAILHAVSEAADIVV